MCTHLRVLCVGAAAGSVPFPVGNTNVLVLRSPGPLLVHSPYVLVVGATDFGEPPATGNFTLIVTVRATTVLQPAFNFTCYNENPCVVRVSAVAALPPAFSAASCLLAVGSELLPPSPASSRP